MSQVPEQVPWAALHPNDHAQIVLKRSTHYDSVPPEHIIHFRRVYFSMCFEADSLLGKVIDALDSSGPTQPFAALPFCSAHRSGCWVPALPNKRSADGQARLPGSAAT